MAERSQLWTTTGVGDGVALGDAELAEWLAGITCGGRTATEGVLGGVGGALKVAAGSGLVSVAAGAGMVKGYYYQNTASLNLTVATPGNGTTGSRVVLRRDGAAQTVRAVLKTSADGTSSAPAVTQGSDVWEVSLATLTTATDGTITVTDARDYCMPAPAFIYRRRGGSSSDWSKAGSTTYSPGGMWLQAGVSNLVFSDDDDSDTKSVTFPQPFSDIPLVLVGTYQNAVAGAARVLASIHSRSKTSVTLRARRTAGGDWSVTVPVQWLAFGPR